MDQFWHWLLELPRLWQRWSMEGPETLSSTILWGHHLFFWGRMGKLLEFIAALAIVADILGPEKLRLYGQWLERASKGEEKTTFGRIVETLWTGLSGQWLFQILLFAIVWVLERPNADKWIKSISLVFLMIGFHFDLLAS